MARRLRKRPMRSPTPPCQYAVQPSSIGWFDLSLEMREMIIDNMDARTRCKLAQCSKLCEEEVKKSNNYLYKFGIAENLGKNYALQILVSHTNKLEWDYSLDFFNVGKNQTIVSYECANDSGKVVKWAKLESGKPEDVRLKYFNEYTEKCNQSIRSFHFDDESIEISDFNIRKFKNLEELTIPPILPRFSGVDLVGSGFIEMKQLIKLKNLFAPDLKLTFEQVIELKAERFRVTSDDFSEANTNKYLKMIKKGEIHENALKMEILFRRRGNIENVENVYDGLGVFNYYKVEPIMEHTDEIDVSSTFHVFNFSSDVKRNGAFYVYLNLRGLISIDWTEVKQPV